MSRYLLSWVLVPAHKLPTRFARLVCGVESLKYVPPRLLRHTVTLLTRKYRLCFRPSPLESTHRRWGRTLPAMCVNDVFEVVQWMATTVI